MKRLMVASVIITVLLVLCTIDDFLSLHDIKADYVSRSALNHLGVETSAPLPPWTDTTLEWTSVAVSYALRSVLVLANLAVLVVLMKRAARGDVLSQGKTKART